MSFAVLCVLCQPDIFGGEPTHHYGRPEGHTIPGLLGGRVCSCPCAHSGQTDASSDGSVGRAASETNRGER